MPEQSFFDVTISKSGTGIDVRVNDGPLYFDGELTAGDIELVANPWVRRGSNVIEVRLVPPINPQFSLDITAWDRRAGQLRGERQRLASLSYRHDYIVTRPADQFGVVDRASFNTDIALPDWHWNSTLTIQDTADTLRELLRELDAIHAALAERNVNDVIRRLELRDREMSAAYFRPERQQNEATRRDFSALVTDSELTLEPREEEGLHLFLCGRGKLARVDDANGDSPIYYLNKDASRVRFLPFIFCLTRENRWAVVR